jgi:hypothetical protein
MVTHIPPDVGALTLAHNPELMHLMVCAMLLRAGSRYGEYYSARSVQWRVGWVHYVNASWECFI